MRTICFIDDDEQNRSMLIEWFSEKHEYTVYAFETVFDAKDCLADVYLIDISATGGSYDPHHSISCILNLIGRYEGNCFAILSAMPRSFCQEVIDEISEASGVEVEFLTSTDNFSILEQYIKEKMMDK